MTSQTHAFGAFVFDSQRKLLLKHGTPVSIGQKCLLLLEALLKAGGQAVSKSDLMLAAWQTDNIEESNLAVQIAALRRTLGRTRHGTEWVTTVQRVGYQFVDADKLDGSAVLAADTADVVADKPSLAVLPFANLTSDPEQDFFSDGVTSDIITELSRWRLLSVRSRSASFRFRGAPTDLKRIARELKVRYVVDGSVRRMAGRIRITVELVDAESGNQVWSEKFDRDANELFSVQDQVVRTIVSTLVGRVIAVTVEQTNRKPPNSLAAYECVLKGNALPWNEAEGAREATQLFAQAVELDPNYGMAHALLGMMLWVRWHDNFDTHEPMPQRSMELAKRAVELDSNESTCFSVLGQMHLSSRSFEPAIQLTQRAIDLNPNNQWNVADMGIIQIYLGRAELAIDYFRRAREIDPFFDPPWYFFHLGQAYTLLRRYDEALATFELCPSQTFRVLAFQALCYAQTNQMARAANCASQCLKICPAFSIFKFLSKEPFKSAAELDFLKESLALAGLPA
jgi:adenylate cyclase